jgi:5,10-methenyltetrahydrofolate synthetase
VRGTVVAVCVSSKKGVRKHPVDVITVVQGHGIEGDAHAGTAHRQISLLAEESIDKMRASGFELSPGDFAENITTRGIGLYTLPVGTRLTINAVELQISQIGKACHAACEIRKLVGDCIMPREGIFAMVLSGGEIKPGDTIRAHISAKELKRAIRANALAARRALKPKDAAQKSDAILQRLKSLAEFESARTILTYVSSKDNEVDTMPLIRRALDANRTVAVPVAVPSTRQMVWSELKSLDELQTSTFDILEPREDCLRPVQPAETDVAIVPGIAFDTECHRIGYGGGYYDRFLAAFPGKKVALAYEVQIYDSIPAEPHDLPVDIIVTEDRTIRR